MNKTHNINLGGVPFIVDEEAFFRLEHYLKALENHFAKSESKDEILGDIEARIAEIFLNGMGQKKIVEELDVIHAIEIMGTPDTFQDEDYDSVYGEEKSARWDLKTGKKLYRDPEDKVIGGVCSGLAAYFGIQEVLWVRIAFAFVFFTMGFGLILYLIMWAIVPEATTSSDRLAMRGEPINVDSIAKNVESGFETISGKIQEISKDLRGKKKSRPKNDEPEHFRASTSERVSVLVKNTKENFEAGTITRTLKAILLVIAILLLLSLFAAWIAVLTGSVAFAHITSFIIPWTGALSYVAAIPFILLIGVPLFSIARGIIRTVRPSPRKRRHSWVGASLFVAGFVGLFVLLNLTFKSMQEEATFDNEVISFSTGTAPLSVDFVREQPNRESLQTDIGAIGTDFIAVRNVDLMLAKSNDDQFHIVKHVSARGADVHECQEAASEIEYDFELEEGILSLSDAYTIRKPNKFRVQEVTIEIQVPQNASITFDEKALFEIDCEIFPDHELHRELIGHTFIMKDEKLEFNDQFEPKESDVGYQE